MSDSIEFPEGPQKWDDFRTSLLFFATRGEDQIRCVLPFESLMDSYSVGSDCDPSDRKGFTTAVYEKNRDDINEACRMLIEKGYVHDGEVVITHL